ncbi:hypothetical protein MRX96_053847 [Rhipicephalus microplus]
MEGLCCGSTRSSTPPLRRLLRLLIKVGCFIGCVLQSSKIAQSYFDHGSSVVTSDVARQGDSLSVCHNLRRCMVGCSLDEDGTVKHVEKHRELRLESKLNSSNSLVLTRTDLFPLIVKAPSTAPFSTLTPIAAQTGRDVTITMKQVIEVLAYLGGTVGTWLGCNLLALLSDFGNWLLASIDRLCTLGRTRRAGEGSRRLQHATTTAAVAAAVARLCSTAAAAH